jgi:hypothetical protein
MAGGKRDFYSSVSSKQALAPQDLDGTNTSGTSIDMREYDSVTFVVNVGALTGGGAMSADNRHQIMLEHGLDDGASAASTWSEVYPSQMLHSVVGAGGAYSTLNSGIFQSIASTTDAGKVYMIGYRGMPAYRHIRLRFSGIGAPSVMSVGAIALLTKAHQWPVNTPV